MQTAASIAATGIVTTTSILTALTPGLTILGVAAPVVGTAIAALIGIGLAIANAFKGCGQTCVQASNIANQVGALLVQNVNAYTGSPIRTVSMQTAALNTFDTAWASLQQACGNAALGAAGQRCITDRQRGRMYLESITGRVEHRRNLYAVGRGGLGYGVLELVYWDARSNCERSECAAGSGSADADRSTWNVGGRDSRFHRDRRRFDSDSASDRRRTPGGLSVERGVLMLASSGSTTRAPALPFDQEMVLFSESRKPISWSGARLRTKPEIRRRPKACT